MAKGKLDAARPCRKILDRWLPSPMKSSRREHLRSSHSGPAAALGTAFLRAALQSMERRKETAVLDRLVLSAYAWTFNHPLSWGAGGPERWPDARAYFTPAKSEDQMGFCIFDWYQAVAQAVLDRSLPVILLQAGLPANPDNLSDDVLVSEEHTNTMRNILSAVLPAAMDGQVSAPADTQPLHIPSDVIACNFWLLASDEKSKYKSHSWFSKRQPVLKHAREIAKNIPCESTLTFSAHLGEDFFLKVAYPLHICCCQPEISAASGDGSPAAAHPEKQSDDRLLLMKHFCQARHDRGQSAEFHR